MLIRKINYYNFIYSYYVYLESNKFYMYTSSSSNKYKRKLKFIYLLNFNEIIKKYSLFSYELKNHKYFNFYISLLENKENTFNKQFLYNQIGKIKIIGRGWKIVKSANQLLIKLGYSHPLFLMLNPYLKYKIKKKKKKYYIFYGIFYDKLNTLTGKFNLMRIPDVYTRKGIFNRKYIL